MRAMEGIGIEIVSTEPSDELPLREGKRGTKPRVPSAMIKEALRKTGGLPGMSIEYIRSKYGLKINNDTFSKRLARDPALGQFAQSCREHHAWIVRGKVTHAAINENSIEHQKLFLKYFGKLCGGDTSTVINVGGMTKTDGSTGPIEIVIAGRRLDDGSETPGGDNQDSET